MRGLFHAPEKFTVAGLPFQGRYIIEDGDHSGNMWQWIAKYICYRCGANGVQIVSAKKDVFPERLKDQEVVQVVEERISKNHRCERASSLHVPLIMEEQHSKGMPS